MLENIGIKTYIVLTDDHAYSLACGINVNKLWAYIKGSMVEIASLEFGKEGKYQAEVINGKLFLIKEENQTIALNPGNVYYFEGDGSKFSHPFEFMNIKYKISSSEPVTIHFVHSKSEYEKILDRKPFSQYSSCQRNNIFEAAGSCDFLKEKGGMVLINSDNTNRAKVDINMKFYYSYSTYNFGNNNISYYRIKEDNCVVLDATAGKYGYPGYDANLAEEKIAIDSMSQEYYYLN